MKALRAPACALDVATRLTLPSLQVSSIISSILQVLQQIKANQLAHGHTARKRQRLARAKVSELEVQAVPAHTGRTDRLARVAPTPLA